MSDNQSQSQGNQAASGQSANAGNAGNAGAGAGNVNINAGEGQGQGQGQAQGQWFDNLDPDLKSNPNITKFKNQADLAKSYIELQKALGKDKVVLPTDKSTPEEWRAFFKTLGAPEKEDEYAAIMDDLPEEIRERDEAISAFRKAAYEAGISKKQFDKIFGAYKNLKKTSFEQSVGEYQKMREKTETELRSEWGAAYDAKVDGAQKVINTFFKNKVLRPEFKVFANDKGFISAMADIADKLGEDVIAGKQRFTMTPQEAQNEINRIIGDKNSPYFNELHPEHDAYVEKVTGLFQMAGAGK